MDPAIVALPASLRSAAIEAIHQLYRYEFFRDSPAYAPIKASWNRLMSGYGTMDRSTAQTLAFRFAAAERRLRQLDTPRARVLAVEVARIVARLDRIASGKEAGTA